MQRFGRRAQRARLGAAETCLADDFEVVAHRVLATVGRERDRATFMAQTRALSTQSSDVRFEYEVVADFDDVLGLSRRAGAVT